MAIVDLDIEEAKKTAIELTEKSGRKVIAIQTDCTDKEQVDAMVEEVVKELGGLDFCHNNAGICINAPAEEMTYEQWLKVININLKGIFLTDIAAGKYMLENGGGSIINTASMSAHIVNVPQPQCAYNAVQTSRALTHIEICFIWIPIVLCVLIAVLTYFYKLDSIRGEMTEELEKRR